MERNAVPLHDEELVGFGRVVGRLHNARERRHDSAVDVRKVERRQIQHKCRHSVKQRGLVVLQELLRGESCEFEAVMRT